MAKLLDDKIDVVFDELSLREVGVVSRFSTSFDLSLSVIEKNILNNVPTITMAGWLTSPASAQIGYLLNRILETKSGPQHRYTLFANSTLEAMYAVIRLCRQTSRKNRGSDARQILIIDRDRRFTPAFDPLGVGHREAFCPDIFFAASESEAERMLDGNRDHWAGIIVVRYPDDKISIQLQNVIDTLCVETGCIRVVSNSEIPAWDYAAFIVPDGTDIVIFGENLANREVPFAAFCVSNNVYETWNNRQSLASYTSTFYGNSTSLSVALENIKQHKDLIIEEDIAILSQIEESFDVRLDYFTRDVHPVFAGMFKSEKSDLKITSAEGSDAMLLNGKKIMDLSGLGCSLRGQNSKDVIENVLRAYDAETDYVEQLTEELRALTRFDEILLSVSGAGAVDNALAIGLLANAPARRIICFSGNYSGKTLPSVNFSKTAPLLADRDLSAFEPYYEEAVYIDPFADDAIDTFLKEVGKGGVALVWFELIQGYMFKRLPAELISTIENVKQESGYLIGVDEVLTGMWKSGETILFHMEQMTKVDITTMSKATSDMIFPISWALVTNTVLQRAIETNPNTVKFLQKFYRNNLGASVALNGIRHARVHFVNGGIRAELAEFRAEMRTVIAGSNLFDGVTSEGSLVRLNLNRNWFPYSEGSIEGTLVEGAISKLLLRATGILTTNLRMFLPAVHTFKERDEVIARLKNGLHLITPEAVYTYMLCQDGDLLNALGMKDLFKSKILASIEL